MSLLIWLIIATCIIIKLIHSHNKSHHVPEGMDSRTTVSKHIDGASIYRQYDGDVRYLNGKPLKSLDDLEQWNVIYGHSENIYSHICEISQDMDSNMDRDIDELFAEWKEYYLKYRNRCIDHRLYNRALNDREEFFPTDKQVLLEKQIYEAMESKVLAGKVARDEYLVEKTVISLRQAKIMQYIANQYGHVALRYAMLNTLAGKDKEELSEYRKAYRRLVKEEILTESKKEDGRWYVRKSRKRKKDTNENPDGDVVASEYNPLSFSSLSNRMEYKAFHTVGKPHEINHQDRTATFKSESTGNIYRTSLSKCTCPYFEGSNSVCKHMVRLAHDLGYYRYKYI